MKTTAVSSEVIGELSALHRLSKFSMSRKKTESVSGGASKKPKGQAISGTVVARINVSVSGSKYTPPKESSTAVGAVNYITATTPSMSQPDLECYQQTKTQEIYTISIILGVCKLVSHTVHGVKIHVITTKNGIKTSVSPRSKVSLFIMGETESVANALAIVGKYITVKPDVQVETTELSPVFACIKEASEMSHRINSTRLCLGNDKYAYVAQHGFFGNGVSQVCSKYDPSLIAAGYVMSELEESIPLAMPVHTGTKRKATE